MSLSNLLATVGVYALRALGPYRSSRLLAEMRSRDRALIDRWVEQLLVDAWPDRVLPEGFLRKYLGDQKSRLGARVVLEQSWGEPLIDEIPSETTPAERRLLYTLFRHFWSGRGNVFEVGPFLGGTTRAIAMGMAEHRARDARSRLFTADKFSDYYTSQALESYLKPLFECGALHDEDRLAIGSRGEFRQVFERIHSRQPYWPLVHVMDGILPDLPEHVAEGGRFLDLASIAPISAFFVDGCKSWYGTKYFLKQAAACAAPGAWFIFQDYGMYTCFWIPLGVYLLRDYFRLMMYTDCTYVWVATRPLDVEEIERRIPDRAEALHAEELQEAEATLIAAARAREDRRALVSYALQLAAVRAYRGELDEARRRFDALQALEEAVGYEDLIARARKSPTYRPRLGEPAWESLYLD